MEPTEIAAFLHIKRGPEPWEGYLSHYTVDSHDCQFFALCSSNYLPEAVSLCRLLLQPEGLLGFTLKLDQQPDGTTRFQLIRKLDNAVLSESVMAIHRKQPVVISVETCLLEPELSTEEALMLPDMEQCVAIAIACHWDDREIRELLRAN